MLALRIIMQILTSDGFIGAACLNALQNKINTLPSHLVLLEVG